MAKRKRRFGDRYDGRRLRSLDPFYRIIPYIMRYRSDAQNFFEDKIEISHTEAYLRRMRKKFKTNISMLNVLVAAMVRTIALRPALNRFIAGQKIYARNEIIVSLAIKKEMKIESPETTIKFHFKPTDTLFEVAEKMNALIMENKDPNEQNDTDKLARIIMLCPGFLIKFIVFLVRTLDYIGCMPRIINELSPFHASFFITDLGSLGIKPIHHHLYDFGTTSIFVAFGMKLRERVIDSAGNIKEKKFIPMKIVTDERTVDGHYYASAFKLFRSLVQHPERLEKPPENLEPDVD
jgi:hypothetical protein